MRGWTNPWKRNRNLVLASTVILILSACGGSPPPLPPPPPVTAGGYSGGGSCSISTGAAPLTNGPVTAQLWGASGQGSMSLTLGYQSVAYVGTYSHNVVGGANLYFPFLSAGVTFNGAQNPSSTFCVSTTYNGQTLPGQLVGSQVQASMYGTYQLSVSYTQGQGLQLRPGNTQGGAMGQGTIQVHLQGYIQGNRFVGQVYVSMQGMGQDTFQAF